MTLLPPSDVLSAVKKPPKKASPGKSVELSVGALVAIPMQNGHFASVWVLERVEGYRVLKRTEKESFYFLVLEGTWPALPSLAEVAASPVASHPPTMDVWSGVFWGAAPADFVVVGTKEPTAEDIARMKANGPMVFQNAEHVRSELYTHWRLAHEPAALHAEWQEAAEARARAKAERRAKLGLPELLREKPFSHWRAHWGTKIAREANTIVAEATQALIDLDGGTKAQRTKILKGIVDRFNALYDREGCVETGEAEEIVTRVEELARAVGLSNEDEALTGHRDW